MEENQQKNGMAIASLVLGIIAIILTFFFWILGLAIGIVGIILGIISIKKNKTEIGIAGVVVSIIGEGLCLIMILYMLALTITTGDNLILSTSEEAQMSNQIEEDKEKVSLDFDKMLTNYYSDKYISTESIDISFFEYLVQKWDSSDTTVYTLDKQTDKIIVTLSTKDSNGNIITTTFTEDSGTTLNWSDE